MLQGKITKNEKLNGMEMVIDSKLNDKQWEFIVKTLGFRYMRAYNGRRGFFYRSFNEEVWNIMAPRLEEPKPAPKKSAEKKAAAKKNTAAKKSVPQVAEQESPSKEDLTKKLSKMTKKELVAFIVANAQA